jgi:hypothetical protein
MLRYPTWHMPCLHYTEPCTGCMQPAQNVKLTQNHVGHKTTQATDRRRQGPDLAQDKRSTARHVHDTQQSAGQLQAWACSTPVARSRKYRCSALLTLRDGRMSQRCSRTRLVLCFPLHARYLLLQCLDSVMEPNDDCIIYQNNWRWQAWCAS